MKLVIERGGRRREVSGWRKWAIAVPLLTIVALVVAVASVSALGLALTVGVVLMAAVPAALVLAFIALVFGRIETRMSGGPRE